MEYSKIKERYRIKIDKEYGRNISDIFIKWYSDRYDKFNRAYIHPKLAFSLINDYHFVKDTGTKWYACVGPGGKGKTTLMKNIFYFLDPTFDNTRVCLSTQEFIKNIKGFPVLKSMKANLMDEPDDDLHPSSKGGKLFREVLGKSRQQQLFLGICATDLKDIPPYIFRKVSTILFVPKKGLGMYFQDNPDNKYFSIQKIRNDYVERGYNIFYKILKDKGGFSFNTTQDVPLDDEKKYISDKAKDYKNSINELNKFFDKHNKKDKKENEIDKRTQIMINMRKKGMTYPEIGELMGISKTTAHRIISQIPL